MLVRFVDVTGFATGTIKFALITGEPKHEVLTDAWCWLPLNLDT